MLQEHALAAAADEAAAKSDQAIAAATAVVNAMQM